MGIYLLVYLMYFLTLTTGKVLNRVRLSLIIAVVPMLLLVWLRGTVGIDTPMYVQSISIISSADEYLFFFEPGFEGIIHLLTHVSDDPLIICKIIATITTIFLVLSRWKQDVCYYLLGLIVIPYFYLDMTMNGLRYGLAFSIMIWVTSLLVSKRYFLYIFIGMAAVSIQVSSLYFVVVQKLFSKPTFKSFIAIFSFVILVASLGGEYLSVKASSNLDLVKPGMSAGLAPLILSLGILFSAFFSFSSAVNLKPKLIGLFAISVGMYFITQFSYAGLRFQQLHLFFIVVFLMYFFEKFKFESPRSFFYLLMLIGILASALRINNFQSESGVAEAPFIPYKFYWSE